MESQLVNDFSTRPLRVLLVDDNESATKMLSKYLQVPQGEYQVGVASNGFQALDYYAKFKPDIVVLDISMPGMDGIETLGRLFKLDKDANIIMATAIDAQRTIEICLQRGAIGYITKPFTPQELVAAIKNALRGGIYKRDLMTFFSRVASKMEGSIHKMIDTDALVVLEDVDVHPHYSKKLTESVSSLRNVPQVKEDVEIGVPSECVGFCTDIGGQLDGTIVSAINKKDLGVLVFGYDKDSHIENKDATILEFFNIINTNVMCQLSDSMHVKLDALPICKYVKDKDRTVKGKDLTKAEFSISCRERKIPLKIYLWFNIARLFQRLF